MPTKASWRHPVLPWIIWFIGAAYFFYDYINQFRVEEVKERLRNPEFKHYSIESIGLDSGFNSKSSFFSIFKKHTSLTPYNYKKQIDRYSRKMGLSEWFTKIAELMRRVRVFLL